MVVVWYVISRGAARGTWMPPFYLPAHGTVLMQRLTCAACSAACRITGGSPTLLGQS